MKVVVKGPETGFQIAVLIFLGGLINTETCLAQGSEKTVYFIEK
jgi:hypothetical protein